MNFDMTTIAEAVTAIKTASDVLKTLKGLWGSPAAKKDIEDKISELQGIIVSAHSSAITAQMAQFSMLQSMRDLETKIAQFETWDREKARYDMKDVNPGRGSVFAYALKPEAADGEPLHLLCPKCFQHRLKSPLQGSPKIERGQRVHFCPECKSEFAYSSVPLTPPGEACPKCGEMAYRVEKSVPHPTLGVMGKTLHQMKCGECGFADQRSPQR